MTYTIREQNKRQILRQMAAFERGFQPVTSQQARQRAQARKAISRRVILLNRRPTKQTPPAKKHDPRLLIDLPCVAESDTEIYPVPDWFRFAGKPDVSVIVPLYKSSKVIPDLVTSWDLDNGGLSVETIFVDDCSPDDSIQAVLRSWSLRKNDICNGIGRILLNRTNLGYGGACNAAAFRAAGDILIFLNADTVLTPNWIPPLVKAIRAAPQVGIVGNLQIKRGGQWDGTIDSAGSEWIWDGESFVHIGRHCYNHQTLAQPFHPEQAPPEILQYAEREMVTGCCFAIPRNLCLDIGGFNPNYRIGYWEDAEICMAVREKGYKVMFEPASKIYHKLGHSNASEHPFHSRNQAYFSNKWVASGRIDPLVSQPRPRPMADVRQILLQRKAARGDVLVAAAIAPALKEKYKGCQITFVTDLWDVLWDNPHIDQVIDGDNISERQFQLVFNLDLAYEYRPRTNILEAYADVVGVRPQDCRPFISQEQIYGDFSKCVVLHAGNTNWAGRNWSQEKMADIANRLLVRQIPVALVGGHGDFSVPCTFDYRGKTNVRQLAFIIGQSRYFVGIDSLPMHIAQAVNTPGVAFFGSINPQTRIYNNCITPVVADGVDCLGCHHRRVPPCVTTHFCETDTLNCIHRCSADDVWEIIQPSLLDR